MQANEELLIFLEGSNYDYYIYSTDALGIALGNSNLSQETQSRMLPVRNQDYCLLAGTQIALSRPTKRLNKAPTFKVGNTIQELELLLATWPTEAIAKADHDGGGERVRQFPANHKGSLGKIDQSWLALLVQENITGVDINVEAQFVASKLIG